MRVQRLDFEPSPIPIFGTENLGDLSLLVIANIWFNPNGIRVTDLPVGVHDVTPGEWQRRGITGLYQVRVTGNNGVFVTDVIDRGLVYKPPYALTTESLHVLTPELTPKIIAGRTARCPSGFGVFGVIQCQR